MDIEQIKLIVDEGKIKWRGHMLSRMQQRGIKINDVIQAIKSGEIIEFYSDDYPFPSCLILGSSKGKSIHVVCAIGEEVVWMITTYYPSQNEWFEDMKTRRK